MRFFEIGQVFLPPPPGELLPDEREYLAVALAGSEATAAVAVLRALADALALPNLQLRMNDRLPGLHPTRAADVVVAGKAVGVVGEVAPSVLRTFDVEGRVAWIELDLGAVLDGPHGNRTYRRVSKYPSSDMDLAFVVPDEVAVDRVRATITKAGGPLLVSLALLDAYRGEGVAEGSRSLTFRLRIQAPDRTLTDEEITGVRDAVIASVETTNGATLRA